jgi:uncharacterized membrane protein SirB2
VNRSLHIHSTRRVSTTSGSRRRSLAKSLPRNISVLLFIIGSGILVLLGSIPGQFIPSFVYSWQLDTLAHVLGYIAFSMLLFRLLQLRSPSDLMGPFMITILVASTLALLDELHQIPIRNRNFDWQDLTADLAGIVVGSTVIYTFFRNRRSVPLTRSNQASQTPYASLR